jgi:succinyl-CoA synthetase beta subunit
LQVVVKSQILAGGRGLGKFTNGLQVCAAQHSVAHGCASLSCSSTPPFVVLSTPHAARGTQQKQENNPLQKLG